MKLFAEFAIVILICLVIIGYFMSWLKTHRKTREKEAEALENNYTYEQAFKPFQILLEKIDAENRARESYSNRELRRERARKKKKNEKRRGKNGF